MEKWLLDTDIGCDTDDCMALGYLLARKDVELMGITTVSGDNANRAMFADVICRKSGKDIPIYCGNEYSFSGECLQKKMCNNQFKQIERYPHKDISGQNKAVSFMKKIIEENPNEITLAAIGQFTNIALLFAVYPHIPGLLKAMVIMGGRYREKECCDVKKWGVTEWNILCDPYAAKIMFDANVKNCYVLGVENTCSFRKDASEVAEKIVALPWMEPVSDAVKENRDTWFHDAVAVWAMISRDRLKWCRGNIMVDIENTERITTSFEQNESGKHFLLDDADTELFFNEYAQTMGFVWNKETI